MSNNEHRQSTLQWNIHVEKSPKKVESLTTNLAKDSENSEPARLKFFRSQTILSRLKEKEKITTVKCHKYSEGKILVVVGTKKGRIYWNDNEVYKLHKQSINQLAISSDGTFVATCSDDHQVIILNVHTKEKQEYEFHCPVISIALDPAFSKLNGMFVIGLLDGTIIMSTEGIFHRKNVVMTKSRTSISSITWKSQYLAFSDESGVTVLDTDKRGRIGFIKKSKNVPPESKCHLCWKSSDSFMIGWGTDVAIVQVKPNKHLFGNTCSLVIDLTIKMEHPVCGIAPCEGDVIVLQHSGKVKKAVGLHILSLYPGEDAPLAKIKINFLDVQRSSPKEYGICFDNNSYFLFNKVDLIYVTPTSIDDRITWLLENRKFDEALQMAEENRKELVLHSIDDIQHYYVDYLFTDSQYLKILSLVEIDKVFLHHLAVFEKDILRRLEDNLNEHLLLLLAKIILTKPDTKIEETLVYFIKQSTNFKLDIKRSFQLKTELSKHQHQHQHQIEIPKNSDNIPNGVKESDFDRINHKISLRDLDDQIKVSDPVKNNIEEDDRDSRAVLDSSISAVTDSSHIKIDSTEKNFYSNEN